MQQEETQLCDGRIVRGEDPLNLEMPFSTLDQFITPTKSFYVRTHFPIPAIDKDAWWLNAEGVMLEEPKKPPGKLRFARSISLNKARADVLLAYKMNGGELPPQHGFPLRAIVPGWYAMVSIKWLQRIIITNRPFTGYYQTMD